MRKAFFRWTPTFSAACEALIPRLVGARLEKIQAPAPDVVSLSFHAHGQTLHLLLHYGRRGSFLCPVQERPAVSGAPSAQLMLLRKKVQGRHARHCVAAWPQRCLYMLFRGVDEPRPEIRPGDPHQEAQPCWLCLDLRRGPELGTWACPPADDGAGLPGAEELAHALKFWRDWPALTPALRRTLPLLDELEQQALLADLAAGGGDLFVYGQDAELEISAWPLPDLLRRGREERIFTDVLEAMRLVGTAQILGALAAAERKAASRQQNRETQRLRRLLEKLDLEEARLRNLADKQREGLALQAQLWRFPPDFRSRELTLDGPQGSLHVQLDPRYSLREHMERFFHSAARGRRGLALLTQRRGELGERLAQAETALVLAGGKSHALPAADPACLLAASVGEDGARRLPGKNAALPANVQAFLSSDGIVVLRGRDAKGNWALLRLAHPYDLWMHVEGGPGAHVLIRRGQGEAIPERSLHEAAQLALVKSWQRDCARGTVMCAQARHVRPVKGAKPGTVRVDKVECALELPLEPELALHLRRL